jgi:hypothetical protein
MAGLDGPILNDLERIVVGPAAVDLAALLLGVQHFGYPEGVAEDFRAGYGPEAPPLEDARPFARIRELSGAVIAMLNASDGPEREMHVRATAIDHPADGTPRTYLGHPDAMHLAGLDGHGARAGGLRR